ncbi:hypothetical protein PTE30175_00425 [Pandoraea terrae]|uniref:DUF2964 domain-containing protein n=1 Tax=Pandoraea terrae TaxID=1537710 RepID=A0A5E4RY79_9BURK|nr:DUF2964 family protein [Pandoraea terrae]VVD68085.1 hypothetical protein PTE30175_00425 [Pandoraea terrae]
MCPNVRVVFAAIAAFVTLGGLFATLHGMLFDLDDVVRAGVTVVICGVTCVVVMLNRWPHDKTG